MVCRARDRSALRGPGVGRDGIHRSSTWRLGLRLGAVLLARGALDYLLQRWFHVRDLRMSRTELVEEVIRLEGNPSLRRKRRAVAMSRRASAASGR